MLKFKLIDSNRETISYRYYPEGKESWGEIKLSKGNMEIVSQKVADGDEFKWYFWKMHKRIKEFVQYGEFPQEGVIVWY